jgi:acyl carrier protein
MTDQELRTRVAELIEPGAGEVREKLLADKPFSELGYDSLDVLEMGFLLEKEFEVDFEGKVNGQNLPKNLSAMIRTLQSFLALRVR